MKERLEQIFADFGVMGNEKRERERLVLPLLQRVQRELGYIPESAIAGVAAIARVSESQVFGVATFYSHFKFSPPGQHIITVCCGTACHVRGSGHLVSDLQDRLQILPGETTSDQQFSLETTACFGSCALAPVVVIDGKVKGRMNRSRLLKTIDMLGDNDTPLDSKGDLA